MSPISSTRVHELNSSEWITHFRGIKRGFEKECLRVNKEGMIAQTAHPSILGSSLTHPFITTDYSEALLEFITPPSDDLSTPFNMLMDLHRYAIQSVPGEVLWGSSMPCLLPKESEIPIAQYGHSNLGQLKHIYRKGLGFRYGRIMQTISGVHYNFSLSDSFWRAYQSLLRSEASFSSFVSEQYLGLIRNCLRLEWIIPFLFGSSPAVCASFFKGHASDLEKWHADSYVDPMATSLRLSDLGYNNNIQSRIKISYNSLPEFIETMKKAVHTPVPEYQRIGVFKEGQYNQLSDCVFQIEDEHYALVRPKRVSARDERMLAAIIRSGIEYIEVRALDVNPFSPIGIERDTVYFLDTFLVACLLLESPPLMDAEMQRIEYNHTQIARRGRSPTLSLIDGAGQTRTVQDWGSEIIDWMHPVAVLLDKAYGETLFTGACKAAKDKIFNPDRLPSAKVLQEMEVQQESYFDFAWRCSTRHQKQFQTDPLTPTLYEHYQQMAKDSIQDQLVLEQSDSIPFPEYLSNYLET